MNWHPVEPVESGRFYSEWWNKASYFNVISSSCCLLIVLQKQAKQYSSYIHQTLLKAHNQEKDVCHRPNGSPMDWMAAFHYHRQNRIFSILIRWEINRSSFVLRFSFHMHSNVTLPWMWHCIYRSWDTSAQRVGMTHVDAVHRTSLSLRLLSRCLFSLIIIMRIWSE